MGGGAEVAGGAEIRSEFPDTTLWEAHVRTEDSQGAQLTFDLPDSLTTWVVDARAVTVDTQVGEAQAELVVTKPLLVRPVTPRFFVVGDYPEVAAVIHNNTANALEVTARLVVEEGAELLGPEAQTITVSAGGRARVTWALSVAPTSAEAVALVFSAEGGGYEDTSRPVEGSSSRKGLPLYRYESLDVVGTAGVLLDAETRLEAIILPEQASDASALTLPCRLIYCRCAGGQSCRFGAVPVCIDRCPRRPVFVQRPYLSRVARIAHSETMRWMRSLQVQVDDTLDRLYARQNPDGGWGWWEDQSNLACVCLRSAWAGTG